MEVEIAGIPVSVVSDDEAETADFVVCAPAGQQTPWADNVTVGCSDCGAPVIHRPYVPKAPPKICLECALLRMEAENVTH